jgi:hypothetical protein
MKTNAYLHAIRKRPQLIVGKLIKPLRRIRLFRKAT